MDIITKYDNVDALECIYMWSPNLHNLLRKSILFAASCQYESEEKRENAISAAHKEALNMIFGKTV
jgi:hypothetical protein